MFYRIWRIVGECKAEKGFTLIELIMVIVVLGILGIVIAPKFAAKSVSLYNAADVLASDIGFTQQEAMNRHMSLSAVFTAGSPIYAYGNALTRARDMTELNSSLSIATTITVTFNSLGEPVGVIVPQTVTITDGTSTKSLTIEPYTGKVTIL